MRDVHIIGAAVTAFGKFPDRPLRSLVEEAVTGALSDAEITPAEVGMVFSGNAIAGLITGQEMVRGQVTLAGTGLLGRPVVNVENACASSSSAAHLAWLAVASGAHDVAVAVGSEKMSHPDKRRTFAAIGSAADVDRVPDWARELSGSSSAESFFMDVYAAAARAFMARSGATAADFARITVKNHHHGSLNPKAQYRAEVSVDQVLGSRAITPPLTLLMCSPVADGAAALVFCSADHARRVGADSVRVRASALVSGVPEGGSGTPEERAAAAAFTASGLSPSDVDVVELHDAAAPNEMIAYEELGLCAPGDAPKLVADGATALGGRVPVNPSGGLLSKGHPLGATGAAQLVELVTQLRGRAGARQVPGARVAMAENAGGYVHPDPAACVVTLLSRD